MIIASLITLLANDSAINALVNGRIYPAHPIQNATFPLLTVSRVSANRDITHSGPTNVAERLMQISCWGKTPAEATQLAEAVMDKLHGYKEASGAERILLSVVENEREFFDEDIQTYHVALDFRITHKE